MKKKKNDLRKYLEMIALKKEIQDSQVIRLLIGATRKFFKTRPENKDGDKPLISVICFLRKLDR